MSSPVSFSEWEGGPNHFQDGLDQNASSGKDPLFPNLRPSVLLCYAVECCRSGARMSDPNALRQGEAQVMKKYSQMKLQMKREALEKLNRRAGEMAPVAAEQPARSRFNECRV